MVSEHTYEPLCMHRWAAVRTGSTTAVIAAAKRCLRRCAAWTARGAAMANGAVDARCAAARLRVRNSVLSVTRRGACDWRDLAYNLGIVNS